MTKLEKIFDKIKNAVKLNKKELILLAVEIYKDVKKDWEIHPSYQGQMFICTIAVHKFLVDNHVIDDKIKEHPIKKRMYLDVSVASMLVDNFIKEGIVEVLDNDLKDVKISQKIIDKFRLA